MMRLTPFTVAFLDRSRAWLRDPEIKALTMTPDFDRESQQRFFGNLPDRSDYCIWGVALVDGRPIGAAGLKHIDGKVAEYKRPATQQTLPKCTRRRCNPIAYA